MDRIKLKADARSDLIGRIGQAIEPFLFLVVIDIIIGAISRLFNFAFANVSDGFYIIFSIFVLFKFIVDIFYISCKSWNLQILY